jgi:hypothetical protein
MGFRVYWPNGTCGEYARTRDACTGFNLSFDPDGKAEADALGTLGQTHFGLGEIRRSTSAASRAGRVPSSFCHVPAAGLACHPSTAVSLSLTASCELR